MTYTSYAQNFEDVMLWRALGHVADGFYIDVGAQHPVADSVSKLFYGHGWRGLHVEPTVHYAALLRQDRPDETVLQAALAARYGTLTLYEIPETGLSTANAGIAAGHREKGFEAREVAVPCVTLADVFALAGGRDIHWLKIDVEGLEREVLEGWAQAEARPWIVVVESTLPLTQIETHGAWERRLLDRGYAAAYFDGLNRFYVSERHTETVPAFRAGPNVFDQFALNGTASATFCLLLNARLDALENSRGREISRLGQERARREREFAEQLRAALRQAGQEKAGQAACHAEREQALAGQLQKERESSAQRLAAQRQAEQEKARQANARAEQERALSLRQAQRDRTASNFQAQLKAQILAEQNTSARLRYALAEAQQTLTTTQSSLAWRLTSPLRRRTPAARLEIIRSPAKEPAQPSATDLAALSSMQATTAQQETTGPLMTAPVEATPPNSATAARTLDELLSYHDQPFVLCAFRTLLSRDPDPEGLNYYLGRVRAGHSKIHILGQLRRSPESFLCDAYQTLLGRDPDPEGREHFLNQLAKGVSKKHVMRALRLSPEGLEFQRKGKARAAVFPGIDKAIRRYQRGRLPLIGWVFRLAYGTESDHPNERKLRAIENQLFLLGNANDSHFNQLESALSGLRGLTAQQAQTPAAAEAFPPAPPPTPEGLDTLNDWIKTAFSDLRALISQQTQTLAQSPEPEGLGLLTPSSRNIYFKLRSAVAAENARNQ